MGGANLHCCQAWKAEEPSRVAWKRKKYSMPGSACLYARMVLIGQRSKTNPNLFVINIEWEGRSGEPFPAAQVRAGIELHNDLAERYPGIPMADLGSQRIVGHCVLDHVTRAADPGPTFPWQSILDAIKDVIKQGDAVVDHLNVLWGYASKVEEIGQQTDNAALLEAAQAFQERIIAMKNVLGLS